MEMLDRFRGHLNQTEQHPGRSCTAKSIVQIDFAVSLFWGTMVNALNPMPARTVAGVPLWTNADRDSRWTLGQTATTRVLPISENLLTVSD